MELSHLDSYIENQKRLIGLEHDAEIQENKLMLEEKTCHELEKLGFSVNNLRMKTSKMGLYGRILITLTSALYNSAEKSEKDFTEQERALYRLPYHRLGAGDNVGIFETQLSFQGQKPLCSCIISKASEYKIVLSLDKMENLNTNEFNNLKLSVVIISNEVTHKRYKNALESLKKVHENKSHPAHHLVKILIGEEKINSREEFEKSLKKPVQKQEDLIFRDGGLNQEQGDAIKFALDSKMINLIHGPPGTGKTKTLCEFIFQAVKAKNMKVLACAASNIAVDNIVERLGGHLKLCRVGHPARMLPNVMKHSLDSLIFNSTHARLIKQSQKEIKELLKKLSKTKDSDTKKEIYSSVKLMRKEIKELEKQAVIETLQDSEVILCTNSGAGDKIFTKFMSNVNFDFVVIDECAQALEISCLIPLIKGKRCILAGDHKQLPPTIKSREAEKELSVTLFDRLMEEENKTGFKISSLLRVQYRMNQKIMRWSSENVYQGQLVADESVKNRTLADIDQKHKMDVDPQDSVLLYMDTANCKMGESVDDSEMNQKPQRSKASQTSKMNIGEADIIYVLFKELKVQGLKAEEIGIITPYNAQVDFIRKLFEKNGEDLNKVEISTVDGFQGREKEAILISMVRSNPRKNVGFLSEYRRMNVAVTRAKVFVGLVGDSETVTSDEFLKRMIEYFQENGDVRSAMEFHGQEDIRFGKGFNEEINTKKVAKTDTGKSKEDKEGKKKKKKKKGDSNAGAPLAPLQEQKTEKSGENHFHKPLKESSEKEIEELLDRVKKFMTKGKPGDLIELPGLNSFQRMKVHECAAELGLIHESMGEGKERMLVLRYPMKLNEDEKEKTVTTSEVKETQNSEGERQKNPSKSKKKKVKSVEDPTLAGNSKNEKEKPEKDAFSNKPEPEKIDPKKESNDEIEKKIEKIEKKKKEKKEKANKKLEEEKKINDMDDMEFLEKEIEKNKTCWYQDGKGVKCVTSVQLVGTNCRYCMGRYCLKHHIAETHGCGEAASREARAHFARDFVNQQKGISTKPLKPEDQEYLKRKLQEKMKKSANERAAKPPKKEKK